MSPIANAYTDTSGSSLGTNLVQTAYDRYVEMALRAMPLVRDVADKRPVQQAMPGSSVVLQIYADLAKATTPLTETVDPDAVALPNTSTVSVTLNEYGNAALVTRKLEAFALSDVDPAVVDILAFNQADSLDELALTTLRGGTNKVVESGGSLSTSAATNTITATDTIKSRDIRYAVSKLRGGKAVPRRENLYWCGIHPDVSLDLRSETGSGGWRTPHEYQSNSNIWAGEIGVYEGAFFVETPRMYQANDGATSTKVSRTIVCGKQALAEAVAIEPHTVIGPVTDKLMRFRPIGWYGLLGWSIFRQAALYRIDTASTY